MFSCGGNAMSQSCPRTATPLGRDLTACSASQGPPRALRGVPSSQRAIAGIPPGAHPMGPATDPRPREAGRPDRRDGAADLGQGEGLWQACVPTIHWLHLGGG
jgi:hypothetical protein